ncbi:aminopeptidase N [Luteibacter sp. UNC138MFCol5.1]|uniref:aminopeptidase N n=1 Tax=Luteibacter sp. UNC138MFCol5.1 TaxID=1502774 RepID=UPI0008B2FB8D|nr:aminopeptidase N [Luteibacter sp. UNC138MFCol5.1]SEP02349.1 aminopeptidase N [Luteibacter sp. UNC138MFCol5.1]
MSDRSDAPTAVIRLADYRPPAWTVEHVALEFDLGIDRTEVLATIDLVRQADEPVRLQGEGMELLSIDVDGRPLAEGEYILNNGTLEFAVAAAACTVTTRVALLPAENTAFEGLYLSGSRDKGFLLTQCEAEGFRHITFFPDRPDVLSRYTVTLRADKARFPVLLAGGNPDGEGDLPDGRHWARFVDPHPKPSYLFALVAGRLERISHDYTTADGRAVALHIWAEADVIDRCGYAMDSLIRSMQWDERTYGRNYDLDVFHVVATHDFNMGAMENKGLNIFNAKYLLADPDSSTDDEYRHVEAVVAHEYFHNWSGNRVTCRDWFQLSLKEGLTVFREQSFSADMNSASLKRIEDVALLRRAQFPEDAGPLSHPVRPSQYSEINNFYTATVYEKGSELVRMLAGRLGEEGFRKGMDLYFDRNDGRAATIEDFLGALGEANGIDLTPYLAWYGQAGTPRLTADGRHDPATRRYRLTLRQRTPATAGQVNKQPLPIPVRLSLFDREGRALPLRLEGEPAAEGTERTVVLDTAERSYVFEDVDTVPVPSLLRGFSAPVILECDYAPAELAVLLRHDPDGFNRWEAGQQLAALAYDDCRDGRPDGLALDAWTRALADLFADPSLDDALLAELLTPPGEIELVERQAERDPDRIRAARQAMLRALAQRIGADALRTRYEKLRAATSAALDAKSQARRQLKRRVLDLIALVDKDTAVALAAAQYAEAPGMTDRLAAQSTLALHDPASAATTIAHFRQRYDGNALALDKWFALQAALPGDGALARVQALEADNAFTLKNPNRVQSLIGTFARANPTGFHRADGAAYRWLADRLVAIDGLNPQVAARVATAFNGWKRLEPVRREAAHAVVSELAARKDLSRDLTDILARVALG